MLLIYSTDVCNMICAQQLVCGSDFEYSVSKQSFTRLRGFVAEQVVGTMMVFFRRHISVREYLALLATNGPGNFPVFPHWNMLPAYHHLRRGSIEFRPMNDAL